MKSFTLLNLVIVALLLIMDFQQVEAGDVTASVIYYSKAQLGEGALWSVDEKVLYWIDIEGRKLFIFNPKTKINQEFQLPERPGTVVERSNGDGVLLAIKDKGIVTFNLKTKQLETISNPEKYHTNRYNDGKCDAAGRFWIGSMVLQSEPSHKAFLFSVEKNGDATQRLDGIRVGNGLIWSHDNRVMYYIDSETYKVDAFDFNLESGSISNRRTVIKFTGQDGVPDGCTIDSDGFIWIAHYGGGKVTRWNPETGEKLMTVWVGTRLVTSVAFGGEGMNELFITTGHENDKDNGGSLFHYRFSNGIKGVKSNKFSG